MQVRSDDPARNQQIQAFVREKDESFDELSQLVFSITSFKLSVLNLASNKTLNLLKFKKLQVTTYLGFYVGSCESALAEC